jgi:TolC family type I secretion outer membrane protein
MARFKVVTNIALLMVQFTLSGQEVPRSSDRPWPVPEDSLFRAQILRVPALARATLDPNHTYTLSELVDIAERNNPETRVAWEQAKQRATAVGIARSALYPTVAALASASYSQYSLFVTRFYHENLATFPAALSLTYSVFDFGARGAKLDQAKANLLAADFAFNDTHRKTIFQVAEAYYHLVDAISQEEAAQATVTDAQTVQQATEARLANGLATLPDVLEGRAATAQARYELASVHGLEEIARGVLASVLGVSPSVPFRVEDVSKASLPSTVEEPAQTIIERALRQRPDLLAQVVRLRSADAEIRGSRSEFFPTLNLSGDWGHRNSYGSENFNSTISSHIYPYSVQFSLNWTVFDGGVRRNQLARAESERRQAEADLEERRNQVENEIWTAYANLKTAQGQRAAADALVEAAEPSYNAATESFQAGVRTFTDVTTAQRDLARARTAQATARVQVMMAFADLAFRVADPLSTAIPTAQH